MKMIPKHAQASTLTIKFFRCLFCLGTVLQHKSLITARGIMIRSMMSITRNTTFQIHYDVAVSKIYSTSSRKKSSINTQKLNVNENIPWLNRARLKSCSLNSPFCKKFHESKKAIENTDALIVIN